MFIIYKYSDMPIWVAITSLRNNGVLGWRRVTLLVRITRLDHLHATRFCFRVCACLKIHRRG